MRALACPIALHPDGAPRRVPVFALPQGGPGLVATEITQGLRPEMAAARALFDDSGLETRAALYIGPSEAIVAGEVWHFALCRLAPPVRDRWQHPRADGAGLARFHWLDLDDKAPDMAPHFRAALDWIRTTL